MPPSRPRPAPPQARTLRALGASLRDSYGPAGGRWLRYAVADGVLEPDEAAFLELDGGGGGGGGDEDYDDDEGF